MSLTMDTLETTALDGVKASNSLCPPTGPAHLQRFGRDRMEISIPEDPSDAHAYPAEAIQVRNTFIHVASPSPAQEELTKPILSCPASHIGWIQELFNEDDAAPPRPRPSRAPAKPVICLEDALLFDPVPDTPIDEPLGAYGHYAPEEPSWLAPPLPSTAPEPPMCPSMSRAREITPGCYMPTEEPRVSYGLYEEKQWLPPATQPAMYEDKQWLPPVTTSAMYEDKQWGPSTQPAMYEDKQWLPPATQPAMYEDKQWLPPATQPAMYEDKQWLPPATQPAMYETKPWLPPLATQPAMYEDKQWLPPVTTSAMYEDKQWLAPAAPPTYEEKPWRAPAGEPPVYEEKQWLPPATQPGMSLGDLPLCPPSIPAPTDPAPGSPELPSIGSAGHYIGDCRPCAFLYAKGCQNGAMCPFCHLCDKGEKKRRQKAKKASFQGGA